MRGARGRDRRGSDRQRRAPRFAAIAGWLGASAATIITAKAEVWHHRDPCTQARILAEIPSMPIAGPGPFA